MKSSEKQMPFTITNESVTVVFDGSTHTVQRGSPQFLSLRQAILDARWEDVPKHLTVNNSLHEWAKGEFTFKDDTFLYKNEALPHKLNARIIKMATNQEDPSPVFKFWERLQLNPSSRSVSQLWSFLQHGGIPLTEDGCFLAYKGVKNNYTDAHSGTFGNKPGTINEMPRNRISDDPREACHEGFHVGALAYASTFSERTVVCKVAPEDVVCVPYDESAQKMRVCKYEVVGNHGSQLPSTTFKNDESCSECEPEDNCECVQTDDNYDDMPQEEEDESVPLKRRSKRGFAKYDKMDMSALLNVSLEELRKYANKGLEIVGASKIPGGKVALVTRILSVRS